MGLSSAHPVLNIVFLVRGLDVEGLYVRAMSNLKSYHSRIRETEDQETGLALVSRGSVEACSVELSSFEDRATTTARCDIMGWVHSDEEGKRQMAERKYVQFQVGSIGCLCNLCFLHH